MQNEGAVLKSQFAIMMNVTPGRVSQWISEGKINGAAIEGEGRSARINPAVAREQLKERLNIDQRLGLNGLSTRLEAPVLPLPEPKALTFEPEDTVETKIKQEKLFQVQLQTERLLEERRANRGFYVRAADMRAEVAGVSSKILATVEGMLPEIAAELAAKLSIPNRDALHILREKFREARQRLAEQFKVDVEGAAETVEDQDTYDEPQRPQ